MKNRNMSSSPRKRRGGAAQSFVTAWLVAGTLDIAAASIYYPVVYHFKLILLYQNIASGVLGPVAFNGGIGTAALGLALHYLIALIWTSFFFVLFPRLSIMSKNLSLTAISYGVLVSFVMTFVVLPLSRVHHSGQPVNIARFAIDTVILMFTIGAPLSLIIGRYYSAGRSVEE